MQGSDGPQRYDLYGIVNHYGALMGGHYTAYVRHAVTGEWQCFDDARVTPVCESFWGAVRVEPAALALSRWPTSFSSSTSPLPRPGAKISEDNLVTKAAYILFYRAREENHAADSQEPDQDINNDNSPTQAASCQESHEATAPAADSGVSDEDVARALEKLHELD